MSTGKTAVTTTKRRSSTGSSQQSTRTFAHSLTKDTEPNGYRTEVDWATQLSYSGVFVHSAPWSVGAQGHRNTSHGCLNVSPSNAEWFYDHSKSGDIVEILNTVGPTLSGTEGLGDWNIPWPVWKAGNAST